MLPEGSKALNAACWIHAAGACCFLGDANWNANNYLNKSLSVWSLFIVARAHTHAHSLLQSPPRYEWYRKLPLFHASCLLIISPSASHLSLLLFFTLKEARAFLSHNNYLELMTIKMCLNLDHTCSVQSFIIETTNMQKLHTKHKLLATLRVCFSTCKPLTLSSSKNICYSTTISQTICPPKLFNTKVFTGFAKILHVTVFTNRFSIRDTTKT